MALTGNDARNQRKALTHSPARCFTILGVNMKKIQDKPERDTTSVSVRFKNSLLAVIDKLAARENRTRANAIETLVIEALDKREGKQ